MDISMDIHIHCKPVYTRQIDGRARPVARLHNNNCQA